MSSDEHAAPIAAYLEVGQKRTFAGALRWPGWCRAARDESAALAALAASAPRYAAVLAGTPLAFTPPREAAAYQVVERLPGTSGTEFGAPAGAPAADAEPFDHAERERSEVVLGAVWQAFDRAARAAEGRTLRKGPRGGGRDRDGIVRHVLEGDAAYLRAVGQRFRPDGAAPLDEELRRTREAILSALGAGERGEHPARGPRGGALWTPRYFVRRLAWHVLDHAWEIEDRLA